MVWAGMRGAVTLAAAQTLPEQTPNRSLLVLVAFTVAAASLLLQGGTLAWVIRLVRPAATDPEVTLAERTWLMQLLQSTIQAGAAGQPTKSEALARLADQRRLLLQARDDGAFSADLLQAALTNVDADQISIELKGGPDDELDGRTAP